MTNHVKIFDTTLRDGEQCPGASMNLRQKMEIARQLAELNVDIIEAGFPVSSDGDFESVHKIAETVRGPIICGLARCVAKDIDAACAAVRPAGDRGRVHVFLATSKIHREHKLRKAEDEIIRLAVEGVQRARQQTRDIEFSPEDASRTEPEFLARVTQAVIEAGATTVNIPDTVGWALPEQYAALITYLRNNVRSIDDATISVHCHDDLGLAVADSLAAIRAGARQVEGTINGIGERAGNAALEEVIMALKTRPDAFGGATTGVRPIELLKTSRLISRMSGMVVPRNKAIVGENAFAHSSGIHQDGILKKRETYEIMDPQEIGWRGTELPLTKHSGRRAMADRLRQLGHNLGEAEIEQVFRRFKEVGDRKKFVHDHDLSALVDDIVMGAANDWELDYIQVSTGSTTIPTATVRIKRGDEVLQDSSPGNGAVDASMKTIDRILNRRGHLVNYHVEAVTEGKDAIGEATLKVDFGDGKLINGKGADTDVVAASARAYLSVVNRALAQEAQRTAQAQATTEPNAIPVEDAETEPPAVPTQAAGK